MKRLSSAILLSSFLLACSSSGDSPVLAPAKDAGPSDAAIDVADASDPSDASMDSGPSDAAMDMDADKSAPCATAFGSSLTNAFGRLDGTVLAVVPPNDQICALPNMTHLVLQVVMKGEAYRMVVDVLSTIGNPDVFFDEIDAPLAAGPWAEGWHPGVMLDYVTTLKLHSTSFTEMNQADVVAKITSEIVLGAHVSVFATSAGEANSAHLVHRNLTNADGAIVLAPESATPHYLLLRFGEQVF